MNETYDCKGKEIWKSIDGFVDLYEVSNLGRIRSLDREISVRSGHHKTRRYRGRILKGSSDAHGYQRVCLWRDNRQYGRIVHRLVLETFVRKMEPNEECNHLDCDKKNNALKNLEISTPTENIVHATNAGRLSKKLTEEQVRQIKYAHLWGQHKQSLAVEFGVSTQAIHVIVSGKYWKRVDLPTWSALHD